MITTNAVGLIGRACVHYGCGCRVTDEAYDRLECDSVANGQTGSPIGPCNYPNRNILL